MTCLWQHSKRRVKLFGGHCLTMFITALWVGFLIKNFEDWRTRISVLGHKFINSIAVFFFSFYLSLIYSFPSGRLWTAFEIQASYKYKVNSGNKGGTTFSRKLKQVPCTATEMIPTIEMIPAIEITPNYHRNDPHHRNDTGGHCRNDPLNMGNEIKRTTKTGQQFSACFLFIYLASFLRCVIYLLPHFILL